jgi:hypothetical protein
MTNSAILTWLQAISKPPFGPSKLLILIVSNEVLKLALVISSRCPTALVPRVGVALAPAVGHGWWSAEAERSQLIH